MLAVAAIVAFGRVLRALGVQSGSGQVETAVRALAGLDPADREDVYWALRASMVARREDLAPFDAAFAAFWDGTPLQGLEQAPPGTRRQDAGDAGGGADEGAWDAAGGAAEEADEGAAAEGGMRWSAVERLRDLDFRAYGPDELAGARRLMERLARSVPMRRTRRLRSAAAGARLDRRATLRNAMRTDGHPVELAWRRRTLVERKLVFVVDVSGSMEAYARPLMMFLHAARRASPAVEGFAFGTRLTRLTRQLGGADPDAALARAADAVPDWAGGTRIGENIKALNEVWGRRGVTRGAVVVIFSDGWERGDVDLLREQMARLRRSARTVVWVNPLAGEPGYEPLAAGMAAALPFVDVFLPGHNLRSLEALAAIFEENPPGMRLNPLPAGRGRNGPAAVV